VDLKLLLERLGEEGIDSVLIEGGGETAAGFLAAGLVDRVSFLIAPILIGGRDAVPAVGGLGSERLTDALRLTDISTEWVGSDLIYSGRVGRA
jgi:diaminohydroxyphosphoribosylaminopyrimidine deaminase/5-amino-6-(5-phosphoribosylamino)uracil reductase